MVMPERAVIDMKEGGENMDLGLKDKVIVAMGGTSNLGKGACIELCREGAKVLAAYHSDDEKAHKTQELIRAEGGEYELCKADCSTEEGVDAVCRAALEKYGRIDGLINSLIFYSDVDLVDLTLEHWNKAMQIMVTSVFLSNKWVVKYWLDNNMPGRIVNFTSVNAFVGDNSHHAYYAAAKAAVLGFTKSVAKEVATKDILATCVAPGFGVDFELPPEYEKKYAARTPIGRTGKPEDLAKVIAYLVSPANTYMTGTAVDVSGGMIMR